MGAFFMSPFFCWLAKNPTFPILLVSVVIAFFGFLSTRHLTRSKHAIDFETEYHKSDSLRDAMKYLRDWVEVTTTVEIEAVANTLAEPMNTHIREVLNTWERAAIAIQRNVYDENLLFNAYGTSVIWVWKNLRPYISKRQQLRGPRMYANFDWLAIRWMIQCDSKAHAKDKRKLEAALAVIRQIE